MKLLYIKANGEYFHPQEPYEEIKGKNYCKSVCYIKKLWFGRWQVDYYGEDPLYQLKNKWYSFGDENKPNQRVILYPSGIEEIRYEYEENDKR